MKKKLFYGLAIAATVLLSSTMFVACGDDDDDKDIKP